MIPDYQTLMRPVLRCAADGEVRISDVVNELADEFELSDDERAELLPSGKQATFANRVNWAKSYLKQAVLVKATRRAHFVITDRGRAALGNPDVQINNAYLQQFDEYQEFRKRTKEISSSDTEVAEDDVVTPDEALRKAHSKINKALAADLLDRVQGASPAFFEKLIVGLLVAMGYGGTSEDAGRALGQSR